MRVLEEELRLLEEAASLRVGDRRVAGAVPGEALAVLAVDHRQGGVERTARLVDNVERGALSGLVAPAPGEHAGVVAPVDHHVAAAVHVRLRPARRRGEALHAVAHAVAFHVRLGLHVEPVAVAEVVEVGVVRVVRGAHGVDVEALHQQHVAEHLLARHAAAVHGRGVVAVHALELHGAAVDPHRAGRAHLHLLEAELAGADVVARRDDERVEVGILRAPEARVGDVQVQAAVTRGERAHGRVGGVVEGGGGGRDGARPSRWGRFGRAGARPSQFNVEVDGGVAVVVDEVHGGVEIADLRLRRREEHHVAVDAGVAEEVLVLEVRAVAPAVDLHGEQVVAGTEVLRDVELVGRAAVLAVAHLLAVHPHVVGAVHALEAQVHGAVLPRVRHGERGAVGRNGIVVAVRVGRIVGVGIGDVRVNRYAVALQLHAARHVDVVPAGVVEAGLVEILRTLRRGAAPVVAPRAVERFHPRRPRQLGREGVLHARERERVGARGLHVHVVDELVLPLGGLLLRALGAHLRERGVAHVRPLRTVRLAQVGPFEASRLRRHGLEARLHEVAQGGLGAGHVGAVEVHHAVAQTVLPGALRVPGLRGHVEVAGERGRVAEHLHLHARHALHLGGERAHERVGGLRLVLARVDAERTRVVALDAERLGGKRPCRRDSHEQAAEVQRLHCAGSFRAKLRHFTPAWRNISFTVSRKAV